MIKYPQMKFAAAMLLAFLVHASAYAGARVVVPSLPEATRPLAEVETNVVFDAGLSGDNLWRLSIELDAAASNCVGVAVGDDAYFRVKVSPVQFPDSQIVWTNRDGHVEFVGGNTGRRVHVRGKTVGDAELEVIIGGRTRQAPTFPLKVVTPRTFKITAWIVTGKNDAFPRRVVDVQNMIAPLNDVYRQVGVSFYLDSVTVTNIPNAYNVLYDSPPGSTGMWTYWDVVDMHGDTGGLECYFINSFPDSTDTLAADSPRGMVVTSRADYLDVAHEIGHAFGMHDIYASRKPGGGGSLVELTPADMVCCTNAPADWNGGSCGSGSAGTRYYAAGTKMTAVLSRMLMKGTHGSADTPRDITAGDIYGVYVVGQEPNEAILKGLAPVGFPWDNVNAQHR